VVQVRVELPPDAIVVGFALIPAVGGPLEEPTVTVAWADAVAPDALLEMKVYVVVVVGETLCDPLTATVAPFRVALTALVDVHVSVELPPGAMETGFALIPAVGPLAPTVTVVWAVAVAPDELMAMKVYVVVAVGETVCDPLTATDAPFRVALTALVDVQVSVELPPDAIEAGLALIVAVGALEVTVIRTWPQSVAPVEL
jgi:hypothetical protein